MAPSQNFAVETAIESSRQRLADLNTNEFQRLLESPQPIVVDFYAGWCGPCSEAAPIIEQLADEYRGKVKFAKLDVDENVAVATSYDVASIPTLIVFEAGKPVRRIRGLRSKDHYRAEIDKALHIHGRPSST
jgi:thioredoxin 1